jgi:hypothetical protein
MSGAAWTMLAVTWSVIFFFTGRFFWMVLKTPPTPESLEATRDGILSKDA